MGDASEEVERLATAVIDAAFAVFKVLGPPFPEQVYERALLVELEARGLKVKRQIDLPVRYRGVECGFGRLDLLVEDQLVVELKACEAVSPKHLAQARSYLAAANLELALVINFGQAVLKDGIRRVILTR